jgi:hypothetical protein
LNIPEFTKVHNNVIFDHTVLAIVIIYILTPVITICFTIFSSLNFQKIWALQDGTTVIVGGKTNRAKAEFPEEMNRLLDRVPEIVESSRSKEPDKISG